MKNIQVTNFWRFSTYILLGIVIIETSGIFVFLSELSKYKLKTTCTTLSSSKDAIMEWSKGNKSLDRNHNGKPCENL